MPACPNTTKERIAAALVAPDGAVIKVIAIAESTDLEIETAKRHAQTRGFTLIVQDIVPFCRDEASLHALIFAEGGE